MALTAAVHISDVPNLDQVPDKAPLYATRFSSQGIEIGRTSKFLVVGHRGNGMNLLQSADRRMKAVKENSILSFNAAAKYPIDFIEFDVQVPCKLFSAYNGTIIIFLSIHGPKARPDPTRISNII
ncbi:hypothetical protein H5410_009791 [Solanum commersonii]|uniref:glycerophosphodiester phosphodiesterase n=1 Tax=Solanum commersonii TaxID=4109 RepID=A0A9J6AIX5_SOLCO|nr:hypothetical protein H5410_009791 [Solanum commersonii]